MNKQEAIEQVKNKALHHCGEKECYKDGCEKSIELNTALEIINQIDEPHKVVIPRFVSEWIEWCRKECLTLSEMLGAKKNVLDELQTDVSKWMTDTNEDILARAWLHGYEIEKEKLYTVEIPNNDGTLVLTSINGRLKLDHGYKHAPAKLTEGKIRDKHDWAWQWAKPVEVE